MWGNVKICSQTTKRLNWCVHDAVKASTLHVALPNITAIWLILVFLGGYLLFRLCTDWKRLLANPSTSCLTTYVVSAQVCCPTALFLCSQQHRCGLSKRSATCRTVPAGLTARITLSDPFVALILLWPNFYQTPPPPHHFFLSIQ